LKATQERHFIFGVKKGDIMLQYFHFPESLANLKKKKTIDFFFPPHLDPHFGLVAFLKPVFQLFRQVLKFCHHLMQVPLGMLANDITSEN
jgi:hypothetical protein